LFIKSFVTKCGLLSSFPVDGPIISFLASGSRAFSPVLHHVQSFFFLWLKREYKRTIVDAFWVKVKEIIQKRKSKPRGDTYPSNQKKNESEKE